MFILPALTLALCAFPANAQPKNPNNDAIHALERLSKSSAAATFLQAPVDTADTWDSLHLSIRLTIPALPADSAAMDVFQTVRSLATQQQYAFNLGPASVQSLEIDGSEASWSRQEDEIVAVLPAQANVGDTVHVRTVYRVPVRSNNYAGGLVYDLPSDVLYTHGEPYTTRWWVSCRDFPGDKVTSDVTTELPQAYRVLSNGSLELDSLETDGLRITRWESRDPISTYLISFAAHPYTVIDGGTAGQNGAEIHYWVYPDKQQKQEFDFSRTPEMIGVFETLFGPYPFNKYDQAVAPIFNGGGAMENQTATTFGDGLVGDGTRRYETVVAHELAHQWWGDHVSPKTFASIWLNEGFASYGEVLWAEHLGPDTMASVLAAQQHSYFREDGSGIRVPLHDPPVKDLFSSTVYDKGSHVLHMLRYLVGDSLFFEGFRTYGETYAYGNAETADFQSVMETVSGRDLSDFFNQWVYGVGYPIYAFSRFEVTESGPGWTASVQLNQTQSQAPLFTIPLPLEFSGVAGDTLVRVPVAATAEQVLSVSGLRFPPNHVEFDPEGWILARYNLSSIGGPATVSTFQLSPAWPNPFNRDLHFDLVLHRPSHLTIDVCNILGQNVAVIADGGYQPGLHGWIWRASPEQSSGVYLLRIQAEDQRAFRKVTLLR